MLLMRSKRYFVFLNAISPSPMMFEEFFIYSVTLAKMVIIFMQSSIIILIKSIIMMFIIGNFDR
jgi:hypothetical protein